MRTLAPAVLLALVTLAGETPDTLDVAVLTAGTAVRQDAPTTLRGRVVVGSAPDIRPVRRAKVTLTGRGLVAPRLTDTDTKGAYRFDLLSPGDHVVYDVADQSLIVTRTKTGDIKAFHNACLHRGTKLRVDDGRVASFRCPFHGWRWSTEGELVELPANWDFPQVWQQPDSCLPEAHVVPGAPADLIAVDLGHDRIAGVADEHLSAALVFSGGPELVREAWVGGRG